jgi:hypothetical protein
MSHYVQRVRDRLDTCFAPARARAQRQSRDHVRAALVPPRMRGLPASELLQEFEIQQVAGESAVVRSDLLHPDEISTAGDVERV